MRERESWHTGRSHSIVIASQVQSSYPAGRVRLGAISLALLLSHHGFWARLADNVGLWYGVYNRDSRNEGLGNLIQIWLGKAALVYAKERLCIDSLV